MSAFAAVIAAPFGHIALITEADALVSLEVNHAPLQSPRTAFARAVCKELRAYLADPKHHFAIPLRYAGSAHQLRVWAALRRIPAGAVATYGELAARVNSSPRAVGHACKTNPIGIVVPCHRIVAADSVGGYMGRTAGSALTVKRWLLAHESKRR